MDSLASLVALARVEASHALPDVLLARGAAALRGERIELPDDPTELGAEAEPVRALCAPWCGAGTLEFPADLAPDALARIVQALARVDDPSHVVAAVGPLGVQVHPSARDAREPLFALRDLEARVGAGVGAPLAPPASPVRRALAALLHVASDDALLLLCALVAASDPRVRRSVRSALVAARIARAFGLPASDVLGCALAALAGAVPPDALAQLRRVASPEAGSTEVGRVVALLGVADREGPHGSSPLARAVAGALAWERVAGEPPRLLHADALARLRVDSRLDADTVEALADVLGPYPPGSAWVLRDGAIGVVIDRPAGRARIRLVYGPDGTVVEERPLVYAADVQPHAPIDLHEIGVDPVAALLG